MWFGSCDALFTMVIHDTDNFHAIPNNEDGRRVITKISDVCKDANIVLVGHIFYVAIGISAKDKLLDKLVLMLDRKYDKLHALQSEVDDLKDCIEIIGY